MSWTNTISDMKKMLRILEEERDVIDMQVESIRNAINVFASRPEAATTGSSQQAQVLRDTIYVILSEQHPLHRRTIYDKLAERGISVGGKDPVNTVGAHLSKDARFRKLGKGEWDLDADYLDRVGHNEKNGQVEVDMDAMLEELMADDDVSLLDDDRPYAKF